MVDEFSVSSWKSKVIDGRKWYPVEILGCMQNRIRIFLCQSHQKTVQGHLVTGVMVGSCGDF